MAKTFSCRPSQLLAINDELHAYWFDRAIMLFGRAVEHDMEEARSESKTDAEAQRRQALSFGSWMRDPNEKPKFKDPADMRG
jgi:hypothetical protein